MLRESSLSFGISVQFPTLVTVEHNAFDSFEISISERFENGFVTFDELLFRLQLSQPFFGFDGEAYCMVSVFCILLASVRRHSVLLWKKSW